MRVDIGNLNDLASGDLAEGYHSLEIVKAEVTEKGTGAMCDCLVTDGPDKDDGSSSAGEKVGFFLLFPRPDMKDGGRFAARNLKKFMDATNFDAGLDGSFEVDDLVGLEFDSYGKMEEYEGNERLRFNGAFPVGSMIGKNK